MSDGIVVQYEDPTPIDSKQKYKYYDNRYFKSIAWSVTGKCNYHCRHCYMDAPDYQLGELPFEEIRDIIDQLAECGIHEIEITGGEPLIRKDFWDIADYMRSRDLFIGKIYTNGWLVNDDFFEHLKERKLHPAMSFSFDGLGWHDWLRGVSGAEKQVIKAIKDCMLFELPVDVEMCIHKGNAHTLRETINFLSTLGVPEMKVGSVQNTPLWRKKSEGNAISRREYYDLLLDYVPHYYEDNVKMNVMLGGGIILNSIDNSYSVCAEKSLKGDEKTIQNYLCGAARFHAYISPEGRFLPCMSITSIEKQKDFPLIKEYGVKKCINDSYYIDFVGARVEELLKRNEKCGNCEYRYKCCGGCRAIAMCENDGELYSPDPESCFLFENGYIEKFHQVADEAIKKYRHND